MCRRCRKFCDRIGVMGAEPFLSRVLVVSEGQNREECQGPP